MSIEGIPRNQPKRSIPYFPQFPKREVCGDLMKMNKNPTPTQMCIARAIIDPAFRKELLNHHTSPEEMAAKYGVPKEGIQNFYDNEDEDFNSIVESLADHVDRLVRIKMPGI